MCAIGGHAYKHVMYDLIPESAEHVDILLVGEGPGKSEDILGVPFIGKSGRLLRSTLRKMEGYGLTVMLSNLVCCRPTEGLGKENRPPTQRETVMCNQRLQELLSIARPRAVVLLGSISKTYTYRFTSAKLSPRIYHLPHPAKIERDGGVKAASYLPFERGLRAIFKELSNAEDPETR